MARYAGTRPCRSLRANSRHSTISAEYVVSAPSTPTIRNARQYSAEGPRDSSQIARKPAANEPIMFTANVPHGNPLPRCRINTPPSQKRAAAPSAPPAITSASCCHHTQACTGMRRAPVRSVFAPGRAARLLTRLAQAVEFFLQLDLQPAFDRFVIDTLAHRIRERRLV